MTLRDQDKGSRLSLFAKHAAKYYAIGASGILVNLGLLYYLTEYVGLWYFLSYALAISVSITSNFILKGIPHETGFSTYYTWEYSGNVGIKIPQKQEVEITIDPNGNLLGPVSVDIIKQ